jgi:hypothetical protein
MHTRSIRVQSYARDDGLWELDAELIDVKAYDFPRRDGSQFPAGQPVHHMHLRITFDDTFTIVAACATYDAAPYGEQCSAIEPAYGDLVGMNFLKGFRAQVKARFGLTAGCTHMTEMSQVLPTVAVQTMANRRRQAVDPDKRPFQIDGCHALRTDGPVVLEHHPKWYVGSVPTDEVVSDPPNISHSS